MPSRSGPDRRSSRQRARRRRLLISWSIALLAGVAAVFASGEPTGVEILDAGYRAVYAVVVTMACAQARRWTWPIVAGGALLGGPSEWWTIAAVVAFVLGVTAQFDRRRRQPVGAVVGALSAQALLRLPPLLAFGVPSLIALLAPLPAIYVAVRVVQRRGRRTILVGALASSAVVLVVVAGFGFGALSIRSDASEGVRAARDGLRLLREGDETAAAASFATARASFDDANRTANSSWMAAARAVPVVAQHVDTAKVLTAEGKALAETSADAAPAVALDELTSADGSLRVDRLVELQPLADDVVTALTASRRRMDTLTGDWLSGPMSDAVDELDTEIDDALPDAELAAQALAVGPELLGAESPKRYLVVFGNPAEARELGGFVASMGVLDVDDGALSFAAEATTPGQLEQQLMAAGATLEADVPAPVLSANPQRFVRNWTDSPAIDTVTAVAADLYPDATGTTIDGILYLDPYVLEALLQVTGPVAIPETSTELTEDDAADYLLRGQYLSDEFERGTERKDRLGDAGEAAFDQLIARLPPPRRLANVLSPLVQARRLQFSTTDESSHALLRRVGLQPAIDTSADEDLLVAHTNRRANKLDAYLERAIRYDAEIDDGSLRGTVTVELTNTAPEQGLNSYQTGVRPAPDGTLTTNALDLVIYSAFDATEVLVDGQEAPFSALPAYGLDHYSIPVEVPAGETVVVELRLRGRIDPTDCELSVSPNASSSTDTLSMSIVYGNALRSAEEQSLSRRVVTSCRIPR